MSELKTNKVSPATGTALAVGDSGDTITVPSGATLDISASTLTPPATMPASSGVNFTALNATNLGSGTVPTARLGSGTADATTFLRGDQTYAAAGGGKLLQVVSTTKTDIWSNGTTTPAIITGLTATITPAATTSKILVMTNIMVGMSAWYVTLEYLYRDGSVVTAALGDAASPMQQVWGGSGTGAYLYAMYSNTFLDSPSSTSALVYSVYARGEAGTMYVNKGNDEDADWGRGTSTITVMEIGA